MEVMQVLTLIFVGGFILLLVTGKPIKIDYHKTIHLDNGSKNYIEQETKVDGEDEQTKARDKQAIDEEIEKQTQAGFNKILETSARISGVKMGSQFPKKEDR